MRSVQRISVPIARNFICKHHYSRGCHNNPLAHGLFDSEDLVGAIAYTTSCSENVRRSIFGPAYASYVMELHRLVVLDDQPSNTESWFIARSLRLLKEDRAVWAIITFADSTEGHCGIIYQASNFLYCGSTGSYTFYRDEDGVLRHPRQNGTNISLEDARKRGWRPEKRAPKHRYIKLLPDNKGHRRRLRSMLRLNPELFPAAP